MQYNYQTLEVLMDNYCYWGGVQSLAQLVWCAGELNINPKIYLVYMADALQDQWERGESEGPTMA